MFGKIYYIIKNMNENNVLQQLDGSTKYTYIRVASNELNILSKKLQISYEVPFCDILPSGMSAISTCLLSIINYHSNDNIRILYGSELYCDTPRLFDNIKYSHGNIYLVEIDIKNQQYTGIDKGINIIFLESCSNPNSYHCNYKQIRKFKKRYPNTIVIIDNTWLTHVLHNPFLENCVDFVVMSLTKYYSGGNCICGAILTNTEQYESRIFNHIKVHGLHVSPYVCQIVSDNIETIDDRIKLSSSNTIEILDKIKNTDKYKQNLITVIHPYIRNENIYNGLYPSVFTIIVNNMNKSKFFWLSKNIDMDFKTSFGSATTRVDTFPYYNKHENSLRIRFAIGYQKRISKDFTNICKFYE